MAMVDFHLARNPKFDNLFHHLLNMVIEAGAWDGDHDELVDYVKIGVGHMKPAVRVNGEVVMVPKSISPEKMDGPTFRRFFDRAVFLVSTRLLGNPKWEKLRDEILAAVDRPYQQERAA
jgi:hypothetical protein